MSTPVKYSTQRPLPPIPSASPNKPRSDNEPANNLGAVVPNKSRHPSPERPRLPLNRPESSDTVGPEVAVSPERQTLPLENSPLPIQDLPASRPKVERRLTSPGKKPVLLTSLKSGSKAQKNSSPFSPYPLSPRAPTSLGENPAATYAQEFNDVVAELAEVLGSELKTFEGPAENKSESDSPTKKPEKPSSHPTSAEDLEISGQNLSGTRSSEKTAQLKHLRQLSRLTTLPTRHRLPREKAVPATTNVQKDPDSTGSGPKN